MLARFLPAYTATRLHRATPAQFTIIRNVFKEYMQTLEGDLSIIEVALRAASNPTSTTCMILPRDTMGKQELIDAAKKAAKTIHGMQAGQDVESACGNDLCFCVFHYGTQ